MLTDRIPATGRRFLPPPLPARRREIWLTRRAMACDFSIVLPSGSPAADVPACAAGEAALDEIARLDERLSVYRPDSGLSRLNALAAAGPVAIDSEMLCVLRTALDLARSTGGAFDCTAGALVKAWGFVDHDPRVPEPDELALALAASGMDGLVLDEKARTVHFGRPGLELNLGAFGKGWAIDRAVELLGCEFAIGTVLVQGGRSSIRAAGDGWSVAIGDPANPRRRIACVPLRNRAIGTSSIANNFFESGGQRYGHILDPRTGRPADRVESATAIAPTAAMADALSTAFFVLGVEGTAALCARNNHLSAVLVSCGRILTFGKDRVEVLS